MPSNNLYREIYRYLAFREKQRENKDFVYPGLVFAGCLVTSAALAGPTGGNVVGGQGSIDQQGLNTTINQASQRLVRSLDEA
jgi:hypothetical protein